MYRASFHWLFHQARQRLAETLARNNILRMKEKVRWLLGARSNYPGTTRSARALRLALFVWVVAVAAIVLGQLGSRNPDLLETVSAALFIIFLGAAGILIALVLEIRPGPKSRR